MMLTVNKFSDEDYQLSEINQLGMPLGVYRLKQRYIRLFWLLNLFLCVIGIFSFAGAIGLGFKNWYQFQMGDYLDFFLPIALPLLVGLYALFRGTVLGRIESQRNQIGRIIICEHGLLNVIRKIRSDQVEAVFWQDIADVRRAFIGESFAYAVMYGDGKILPLTNDYQNIEEIIAQIKQRSREIEPEVFEANSTSSSTAF